jgi:hypothetical protein
MFLNRNIYKFTGHLDGKQDRRRHSKVLNVRSFRGAGSDTEHYPEVAKFRERLAVCKGAKQNLDTDKFNFKNYTT